jgi:hypothetical protein
MLTEDDEDKGEEIMIEDRDSGEQMIKESEYELE